MESNLTTNQQTVLLSLLDHGYQTSVHPSTLKRLEEKKLVKARRRRSWIGTREVYHVDLTPKGRKEAVEITRH